jgi:hypothetical protein
MRRRMETAEINFVRAVAEYRMTSHKYKENRGKPEIIARLY